MNKFFFLFLGFYFSSKEKVKNTCNVIALMMMLNSYRYKIKPNRQKENAAEGEKLFKIKKRKHITLKS